jgi:hypothetical protein
MISFLKKESTLKSENRPRMLGLILKFFHNCILERLLQRNYLFYFACKIGKVIKPVFSVTFPDFGYAISIKKQICRNVQ